MKDKFSISALCICVLVAALMIASDTAAVNAQRARRNPQPQRLNRASSTLVRQAENVSGDSFNYQTRTPGGVQVFSVVPARRETLAAIDNGFANLFAIARRHNYRRQLNHGDYTVFIARPDRTRNRDGAYSPDIAVGAAQYAGSVYDAGGFIYAAGLVLNLDANAFIIAEHTRDFARVSTTVRYEAEHLILYHNDARRFQATLDHSRGGGHPILR